MDKETLIKFLRKSGLKLAYVANSTGICRTQLSYFIHDHFDLSAEKKKKVIDFMNEYKSRWQN